MDHAEAGEVAIFGAERAVEDVHVLDQFRRQALQRPQIALAVALRPLILLHVVHQHFQPAVNAAVIEVEAEAPDLERFAAAFVLPGIDAGIERSKTWSSRAEKRVLVDGVVAPVDGRVERCALNDYGLVDGRDQEFNPHAKFSVGPSCPTDSSTGRDVPALEPHRQRAGRDHEAEMPLRVVVARASPASERAMTVTPGNSSFCCVRIDPDRTRPPPPPCRAGEAGASTVLMSEPLNGDCARAHGAAKSNRMAATAVAFLRDSLPSLLE